MADVNAQQGSLLLIPDHPLQVIPSLAAAIGLNEAIVLQQVHYWSLHTNNDGGWVHNTLDEWREQFPFWSADTIKRAFRSLREKELVEVSQPGGSDRTNYYRVRYDQVPRVIFPSGQVAPMKGAKSTDQEGKPPSSIDGTETTHRTPPTPQGGKAPKKKVNRKPVTDDEYALATAIVVAFNEIADTRYEVDAHLTPVVGRIREKPDLTAEQHRAVIAAAFADPHWKGHPSPAVVYGNAALFESQVEKARKRKRGGKKDPLQALAERDD